MNEHISGMIALHQNGKHAHLWLGLWVTLFLHLAFPLGSHCLP